MRILYIFFVTAILTSCAQYSTEYNRPLAQQAFRDAQNELNKCLMLAQLKFDDGTEDIMTIARVMAAQCEYVTMRESIKLKKLDYNPHVIEGFTTAFMDRTQLLDNALIIAMNTRKSVYASMRKERELKKKKH